MIHPFALVVVLFLAEFNGIEAQTNFTNKLKVSESTIDRDYLNATLITEEAIRLLSVESAELHNAYKQLLVTDDLGNHGVVEMQWRTTVRNDILRRGREPQLVIERIFTDTGKRATSLLRKIELFPDIDKQPFVRMIREMLENGRGKEIQTNLLSQYADFVAMHGALGDLDFLEIISKELQLDDPYRLQLIEKRREELAEFNSKSKSFDGESSYGPDSPSGNAAIDTDSGLGTRKSNMRSIASGKHEPPFESTWTLVAIGSVLMGVLLWLFRNWGKR